MAIEIVDLPINSMVIPNSYVKNYRRGYFSRSLFNGMARPAVPKSMSPNGAIIQQALSQHTSAPVRFFLGSDQLTHEAIR
jgi:hypothetical protein